MWRSNFAIALLLLIAFGNRTLFADIQIDDYSAATNDRFTNVGTFIMSSYDLSGVGQSANGRWATLISNNVIISAHHSHPAIGDTVYFYPGNDPAVFPITRTVTSNAMRVGSTDLWIAVLDHQITSLRNYAIADEFLSGTPPDDLGNIFVEDAGSLQDMNAYLFGRSPQPWPTRQDQAVGRNLISGFSENVPLNGDDNDSLIMFYDDPSSPDYVQYESHFRGGDSGGPLFVDINGNLILLGTNAFTLVDEDTNAIIGSGVNYVGNQAFAIRAFIEANAVPEPSSFFIVAIIAAVTPYVRARRRKS